MQKIVTYKKKLQKLSEAIQMSSYEYNVGLTGQDLLPPFSVCAKLHTLDALVNLIEIFELHNDVHNLRKKLQLSCHESKIEMLV